MKHQKHTHWEFWVIWVAAMLWLLQFCAMAQLYGGAAPDYTSRLP